MGTKSLGGGFANDLYKMWGGREAWLGLTSLLLRHGGFRFGAKTLPSDTRGRILRCVRTSRAVRVARGSIRPRQVNIPSTLPGGVPTRFSVRSSVTCPSVSTIRRLGPPAALLQSCRPPHPSIYIPPPPLPPSLSLTLWVCQAMCRWYHIFPIFLS